MKVFMFQIFVVILLTNATNYNWIPQQLNPTKFPVAELLLYSTNLSVTANRTDYAKVEKKDISKRPMYEKLPSFKRLFRNYPLGSPEAVKELIGGYVNRPSVVNTCVIRLSRSLNYADALLPRKWYKGVKLITLRGGDNKRYAVRVREMKRYLKAKYGRADLIVSHPRSIPKSFKGKKGIIVFDQKFKNATGHTTLWNGYECVDDSYYWKSATKVYLWITP